jgi:integrase
MRHSAAFRLIAQGVHPKVIQESLRHSSIRMTMDTCGHRLEQVQQETADKMGEILRLQAQSDPNTRRSAGSCGQ